MATLYVERLVQLCEKAGIAVPNNIRADQQLTSYLIEKILVRFEEWVDVSAATANTAADIAAGKVAYGYTATQEPIKLTGAATTVSTVEEENPAGTLDIATGKIAFVNGEKITGTATSVDTTTADAVAADIAPGKTAFVNGEKITGTSIAIDTTEAENPATAADIAPGKVAFVNGAKVTGTSTAVDTSDADATAADIAEGKTAYVNGVKIVGTAV